MLTGRARFFAYFCLCAAPIALAGVVAVGAHLSQLLDDPVEDLTRHNYDVSHRMSSELAAQKMVAERLAEMFSTKDDLSALQDVARALLLPQGQNLIIQDLQGRQTFNASYPVGSTPGRVNDAGGIVARARAEQRTVVSDMFKGVNSTEWRIAIVTPLFAPNRTIKGTLMLSLSPTFLSRMIGLDGLIEGARWAVMDGNGRMMARSHKKELIGETMTQALRDATVGDGGVQWTSLNMGREPIIRTWVRMPETNWVVAVVLPQYSVLVIFYTWLASYIALFATGFAAALILAQSFSEAEGQVAETPAGPTWSGVSSRLQALWRKLLPASGT